MAGGRYGRLKYRYSELKVSRSAKGLFSSVPTQKRSRLEQVDRYADGRAGGSTQIARPSDPTLWALHVQLA
jgi:hypothetical protein